MIQVNPVSSPLKAGDTFTMKGKSYDDRNWWQRHIPHWLGGLPDPIQDQTLVILSVTSGATFIEGNPLCLTPDFRYRINGDDQ